LPGLTLWPSALAAAACVTAEQVSKLAVVEAVVVTAVAGAGVLEVEGVFVGVVVGADEPHPASTSAPSTTDALPVRRRRISAR
jgi:hypothetical protein